MAKKQIHFQVGICPHCPATTRQVFVEGIHEYSEEIPDDDGKRYVYGDVHTLSFFRCDSCHAIVGYRTYYADAVDIDEAEKLDQKWVLRRDDCGNDSCFQAHASLIYSTHQRETNRKLSEYAPDTVRTEHEEALRVKPDDPSSFAMRIRRALEAICIDQGEPGMRLDEELKRLERKGVFPRLVADIAHELKILGNAAAHLKPRTPREIGPEQAQAMDEFFHVVVDYVYDAPAKLRIHRELLAPEVTEIESAETVN